MHRIFLCSMVAASLMVLVCGQRGPPKPTNLLTAGFMSHRGNDGVLHTLDLESDERPTRVGRSDTPDPYTIRPEMPDVIQSSSMSKTDVNLQHLKRSLGMLSQSQDMSRAPESINGIRRIQFADGSVIYVPDSTTKPPQAEVVNAPIVVQSQFEMRPSPAPMYDAPFVQNVPGVRVSGNTIVVSGGNGAPGGSNGQNGADGSVAVQSLGNGQTRIRLGS